MTKDEALKMCLEYIETDAHERKYVRHAIKEALAQQEPNYKKALEVWLDKTEWIQETVKPHELGMHRADVLKQRIQEALAQPEPVAWEQFYPDMGKPKLAHLPPPECKTEAEKTAYAFGWFKSMEAQRTWVGLTDGERNGLWRVIIGWGDPSHDDVDLMKAIEAALRSKNA